ncbi:ABC transporter permease [Salinisphaera sp. Q1T1-3]|uniref:ABC transporter permease n=1 Tax=Salinisphaera sp. Q1T1-3 TaxID=2321229 RepID=UPI000E750034|nr:ABC transporter permease [Salinisphaera sp. Q1T1-3]RJS93982.1 ABC transporter permease [Salinisphaera sp. Q1T1-3]
MSGLLAIARHEITRLFVSPLAWTIAAAATLLSGLLFTMALADIVNNPQRLAADDGVTALTAAGLFRFVTLLLLLIVPVLTMRGFAEERKTGTLELLSAAPISTTALVLGKFIGVMTHLTLIWALVAAMPLTLGLFTPLDPGMLAAGLIGLWLVMAAFAAIGLLASSLTREPPLAAVYTLAVLLLAWLAYAVSAVDWQPRLFGQTLDLGHLIRGASPIGHDDALLRGLFSSADVAYFVILTSVCLALTVTRLTAERC